MVVSWDDPRWFDVVTSINKIKVEYRGENMTGPFKSGYMRVNGMIKATNWGYVQKKNGIGWRVWMDHNDVDWAKLGNLHSTDCRPGSFSSCWVVAR